MNVVILVGAALLGLLAVNKQSITETIEEKMPSWNRFDELFKKYAAQNSIPWTWLKAIALNESSLGDNKSVKRGIENPKDIEGSKSTDGKSWGLMQVTLTTARDMDPSATAEKLNNPEYSVKLAAQYLKKLSSLFSKLESRYTEWVIKSYNQGPGNSRKERDGTSQGFAAEYWARFQRNLKRVEENDI